MAQFDWSMLHNALAFQNMQRILQFRARPDLASNKYKSLKSGKPSYLYPSESVQDGNKAKKHGCTVAGGQLATALPKPLQ